MSHLALETSMSIPMLPETMCVAPCGMSVVMVFLYDNSSRKISLTTRAVT